MVIETEALITMLGQKSERDNEFIEAFDEFVCDLTKPERYHKWMVVQAKRSGGYGGMIGEATEEGLKTRLGQDAKLVSDIRRNGVRRPIKIEWHGKRKHVQGQREGRLGLDIGGWHRLVATWGLGGKTIPCVAVETGQPWLAPLPIWIKRMMK